MSGVVVPVLEYRAFNFSFVASGSEEQILQNAIPVAPYTAIGLSVRVHALKLANNASFQFEVRAVNPSRADGADFVNPTPIGSTSAITNTVSPPNLVELSSNIENPQSPYIRVVLVAAQSGVANELWGIFSADLTMKTG